MISVIHDKFLLTFHYPNTSWNTEIIEDGPHAWCFFSFHAESNLYMYRVLYILGVKMSLRSARKCCGCEPVSRGSGGHVPRKILKFELSEWLF